MSGGGLWLQVYDLWHDGGVVMPSLFVAAALLWYVLGLRLLRLRRGDGRTVRALLHAFRDRPDAPTHGLVDEAARRGAALVTLRGLPVPARQAEEALSDLEDTLHAGTSLSQVLVAVAPLLGLLGTVTGLIETFGSLGQSSTSAASEGIAGGIVEALYATQMGLAIAVPGLLVGGLLRSREDALRVEIESIKALICGSWRGEP